MLRTVSLRMADLEKSVIPIGYQDENLHTQVRIDCLKVFKDHPQAIASLAVISPKGDKYPAVTVRDGDYVIWNVTASDTAQEDVGEIQLTFSIDGVEIEKSPKGKFRVKESIRADGTAPDPIQDWITEANVVLGEIPVAISEAVDNALEVAKESGEFDGADGKDGKDGQDGYTPQKGIDYFDGQDGQDGQDGFSPIVSTEAITGGHRITITDAEGAHPVDVMDGIDGQNGKDGEDGHDGADGHTPVITAEKEGKTTEIFSDGVKIAEVEDGQDGTDSPVQDVQMNGTSLLDEHGVATVPMASTTEYGVMSLGGTLEINSLGKTGVKVAGSSSVKGGTSAQTLISPKYQNESVFYGLAKLAGADMAQSSNPVGTFTPEALVAIQKMLGVYEPPYELVKDITLEERTTVVITTDDNGQQLNLLSLYMEILYPANAESETTGYGRYYFYDSEGGNACLYAETSKFLTNTSNTYKLIEVSTKANKKVVRYTSQTTVGYHSAWMTKAVGTADQRGMRLNYGNITRIVMNSADHEPAGTRIRIWAQKAY